MRDPKRIKRILKKIEKIWLEHPDLRLMQLLFNSVDLTDSVYYMEDFVLEEYLGETYLGETHD